MTHVLWAILGLAVSLVPFGIFGGGIAIPAASSFLRAKDKGGGASKVAGPGGQEGAPQIPLDNIAVSP